MIIDGQKIASEISEILRKKTVNLARPLSIGLIYAGVNPIIDRFIAVKKKFGEKIGVRVEVYRFDESISQEEFYKEIKNIVGYHDGVVIQLPLPEHLNQTQSLSVIPPEKDIDVLSAKSLEKFIQGDSKMRPPVAGACEEILARAGVELMGKKITVIGQGRLVGIPVLAWLRRRGVEPTTVGLDYKGLPELLKRSDIIISGAGAPGLIKPDMIKSGVIILDAGTSESLGRVVGDAELACAERAEVFTPVPGGLGPVTVAVLFQNLFANL